MSEDRPIQDAVSAAEPAFTKPLAPGSKAIYSKDGTKVITVPGTKKQPKKKTNKANGHSSTAGPQASSPTPSSTNSASSHHDHHHQHHHDHHHRHTNTTHRNQQHHGHDHFHDIEDDDDIELVAGHNVNFEYHGEALVTIGNPSSKGKKSQDKIWDMSTDEERERIKKFWAELSEGERRDLVKIEKNTMLQKMKDQQRHSCSCSVCGRKRLAIEQELESLYDAYYADLENVAEASTHLHRELERSQQSHSTPNGRLHSDDTFANNLTIQGGILTVADDLLKNDGKKFIDMMEKLAERRLAREEETLAQAAVYGHDQYDDEEDDDEDEDDDDDLDDIDEEIDDEDDEDDYDDDDYEDEDDDDDVEDELSEERRAEDGRKMLQIFAARMFEQRVLNAYREKVAQERQQKLLDELDEEDRLEKEREAKRLRDRQKKKEKKKQQQLAKDEEKRKKEEEKQRVLDAQKAEQQRKQDEAKKRKAEQKAKLEAEKRAKEDERKKRVEEDKRRELEKLKKKKEKEEREKEEKRKRELEEKRKMDLEAKKRDDEIKRQQDEEQARRLQEEGRLREEVNRKRKEDEQRKRDEDRQRELSVQRERDEKERLRLQNQRQLLAALSSGTPPPPGAHSSTIPHTSSSAATALAAAAVSSAAASTSTTTPAANSAVPPHLHSMNPQHFPYPSHIPPPPQGMSIHPAMPLPQTTQGQSQHQHQQAPQQPQQQQQQTPQQQPAPQIWGYSQPMFMGQQQQPHAQTQQHNTSPPQVHTQQPQSYMSNNGFGLAQGNLANGFASPLLNQANSSTSPGSVPMPIQRPGSTSQSLKNTGMDDIMRRLGSRALMEDDDEFYPHRTHAANGSTSNGNNSVPQSSLNSPVHRLAPTLMNGNDLSNGSKMSTPATSSIFGLDWSAGSSSAGGSRLWSSPTTAHGIVNKPASPWGNALGDRRVSPMPHIGGVGGGSGGAVSGSSQVLTNTASHTLRSYAIQAIRQSPSDSDGYVPVQMLFHATQKLAPMNIDQLDLQLALSIGQQSTSGDRFDAVRDHVGLITKVKYIPVVGFENSRIDMPKTPAQLMQSQWDL